MSIRRKNSKPRRLSVAKPVVARKRNARKKIKLVVAKPAARRKRNARRVVAASAPALMTVVTKKRKANRKPRRKAKRAANRRRRNPSALATLSPLRRGLSTAHTVGGKGLAKGRKSNGRRRHAIAKRKRNPGFDVQKVLIKGAVLIAGAYVAKTITDKVVDLCVDTLKIKDDSTLGYVQLLGAIGVVALGEYLQSEFGSADFDLQPATYAIASFMATDGLNRAFPPAPKTEAPSEEQPAPMNGTMITEYSPSAMNGTMNASGDLPHGYSMLGSLFTDSQLPGPAVGPHNVMQGLAYGASGLAYGSAGVPSLV